MSIMSVTVTVKATDEAEARALASDLAGGPVISLDADQFVTMSGLTRIMAWEATAEGPGPRERTIGESTRPPSLANRPRTAS
jgi:hypothetical protein